MQDNLYRFKTGGNIVTNQLETPCQVYIIIDTIGLNGTPNLFVYGKVQIQGRTEPEGLTKLEMSVCETPL